MGIAGHQYILILIALSNEHFKEIFYRLGNLFELGTGKQFQVDQHLIVSGASAMNFLAHIAQFACQHQFDLRMNIFNAILNYKLAFFC